MSENDLHYEHLLPHSPVFTLGFTGLEPHQSSPQVLDLPPHFAHAARDENKSFLMPTTDFPRQPGGLVKTRKFLKSPATSSGLNKVSIRLLVNDKGQSN